MVLEEVRTKRVQEMPTSAAACTRVAEATQGSPYQTGRDGAGKSPCAISYSSQCVDHNLHNVSVAPCLFANVTIVKIIVVNYS